MEKGWNAAGLLKPLWGRVGGRDKLAEITGIQPSTLSGYNAGRLPLGRANAEKIAAALNVPLTELGVDELAAPTLSVSERLEALAAASATILLNQEEQRQMLEQILDALQPERGARQGRPKRRRHSSR